MSHQADPSTALDTAWIRQWVDPCHLTDEALDECRNSYRANDAFVLVIDHLLIARAAQGLGTFLETHAIFETRWALKDRPAGRDDDNIVTEEEWLAAPDERRFFRFATGPRRAGGLTPHSVKYMFFETAIRDRRFIRFVESVTGVALGEVSTVAAHAMGPDDMLRPHSDSDGARKLAFLIYLSEGWRPEFGGALSIRCRDESTVVIPPLFNRFVVFDVEAHIEHWVEPIGAEAGSRRRLSIGGWIDRP